MTAHRDLPVFTLVDKQARWRSLRSSEGYDDGTYRIGPHGDQDIDRLWFDVPWYVHGDPRHSGRGNVAADDPERSCDFSQADDRIHTVLLVPGGDPHPPA